jgi:hypothetical protein
MGNLSNISQYFHPVGTPLSSWNGIPVMPTATSGQEFNKNVYSLITPASLDQAAQFYQAKAMSLNLTNQPVTTSAGSGSQATHAVVFSSYNLTIDITSYDNDTGHVIVVFSKSPYPGPFNESDNPRIAWKRSMGRN